MRSFAKLAVLAGAGTLLLVAQASAQQIASQAALAGILGGNMTMEDFEGNGQLPSGQLYQASAVLNSGSTFAGYGPGLVQAGVDYSANSLWWNDNGYFGLNTRTLADSSAWRGAGITITYTSFVTAFGFDMQGYSGYGMSGVIDVYDTSNNLLSSTAVNGGFFGWQNAAGIGRVYVAANSDEYIMVDNHGYGAVPEPSSLVVAGIGLLGLMRRRATRS